MNNSVSIFLACLATFLVLLIILFKLPSRVDKKVNTDNTVIVKFDGCSVKFTKYFSHGRISLQLNLTQDAIPEMFISNPQKCDSIIKSVEDELNNEIQLTSVPTGLFTSSTENKPIWLK